MMITLLLSAALAFQGADAVQPETAPEAADALPEAAEVRAAPVQATGFDADAALADINAALNAIESMRARFVQVAPNYSASEGVVSIRRPGRLRFEYETAPVLIVADGTTVAVQDRELDTIDRVPLRATPLWWLLKPDIDLAADANITGVERRDGFIYVFARDREGEMEGEAVFLFDAESYALTEWFVVDALGETTRMTLSEVETGVSFDPRLFILDDPEPRRRGRR